MISDFDLLGITETDNLAVIKHAYRKRALALHPDTASDADAVRNYYLFVQVSKAYQRLCSKLARTGRPAGSTIPDKESAASPSSPKPGITGSSLAKHADPAYAYYKRGITFFSNIHPSQWNMESASFLNTRIPGHEKSQNLIKEKLQKLVALFPKAYFCFSVVVNEYPDSVWYSDAKEKMGIIEERMTRYKNIIESFTEWNEYGNKKKKHSEEMHRENVARYKNFNADGWE